MKFTWPAVPCLAKPDVSAACDEANRGTVEPAVAGVKQQQILGPVGYKK